MGSSSHTPNKLSAVSLKHLSDGSHSDGGNLYLLVRGSSRSWVFRYVDHGGSRRNMGLGSLSSVSLAQARKRAAELREQLRHPSNPSDPLVTQRASQASERARYRKKITFRESSEAYINAHRDEWKNSKHTQQWENTLATYAHPFIGDLPVADIDQALILKLLTPIWNTKTETAKRLRGRIESILDWATFNKHRQGDNPARWRGHLEHSLAKPSKIAKIKHHAAMPYRDLPSFMVMLRAREGVGARALEFLILTAARSGEVRAASWNEVDIENKLWIIPSERTKMEREHRVALSQDAIRLLVSLPRLGNTDLLFPSSTGRTSLSDMTLTAILRRGNLGHFTVHGFRSTFRDWVAETTNYQSEVAEMALAHVVSNKVEAAYRRGDLLSKRFALMNEWAAYCRGET